MTDDVFFRSGSNPHWNACIGIQSDAEAYIDGYLEAASELIGALFTKGLYDKRDTLVFPILYNTRHSIELMLKHTISVLRKMNMFNAGHRKNHDILSHWQFLVSQNVGDEAIRELLSELEPYVRSLAQIDDDGQELRYQETRGGQVSLDGRPIVSLEVIKDSIAALVGHWGKLKRRLIELSYELKGGFFTRDCSRRDLIKISVILPNRDEWGSKAFQKAEETVKERYQLSKHKFSEIGRMLQKNRQTKLNLGIETPLVSLSDGLVEFLVSKHLELNARRRTDAAILNSQDLKEHVLEDLRPDGIRRRVLQDVMEGLSRSDIADIRTIFYLARNGELAETYEDEVTRQMTLLDTRDDDYLSLLDVFEKTNFAECLIRGIGVLGRPSLSAKMGKYPL